LNYDRRCLHAYIRRGAPADASGYRYFVVEGYHVFVAGHIKIPGPLTLSAGGIWKFKQLFLNGAGAAVSFWLFEEN